MIETPNNEPDPVLIKLPDLFKAVNKSPTSKKIVNDQLGRYDVNYIGYNVASENPLMRKQKRMPLYHSNSTHFKIKKGSQHNSLERKNLSTLDIP